MSDRTPPRLETAFLCQSIELDALGAVYALQEPMSTLIVEPNDAGQLLLENFYLYTELWTEGASGTFTYALQLRCNGIILDSQYQPETPVQSFSYDPSAVPNEPQVILHKINRIVFPQAGVYHIHVLFSAHASLNERSGNASAPRLRIIRAEPGDLS